MENIDLINGLKLFSGANVLEVGGNAGDITDQILKFEPAGLTVTDLDAKWCDKLNHRFKENPSVTVLLSDILDSSHYSDLGLFDVVLLKELINALPRKFYGKLFENCSSLLSSSGRIIIVDYSPMVKFRHFIFSTIKNPLSLASNIERLIENMKFEKTLSRKDLQSYFPQKLFTVCYIARCDFLNSYDSFYHKILERLLPCKYVAVITKNNS